MRIRVDLLDSDFEDNVGDLVVERLLTSKVDIEELLAVFKSVLKNYWSFSKVDIEELLVFFKSGY